MSFSTDLVEGYARLLAAAGIGLSWSASGIYPAGQTGIFVLTVPQTPNRLVAVGITWMNADPSQAISRGELNVRSRSAAADPRDVFTLDDSVQNVLIGNYPLTLPTDVRVSSLAFLGGGSLGQDSNQLWGWSSNYVLDVYRPTPHRN